METNVNETASQVNVQNNPSETINAAQFRRLRHSSPCRDSRFLRASRYPCIKVSLHRCLKGNLFQCRDSRYPWDNPCRCTSNLCRDSQCLCISSRWDSRCTSSPCRASLIPVNPYRWASRCKASLYPVSLLQCLRDSQYRWLNPCKVSQWLSLIPVSRFLPGLLFRLRN